MHVNDCIPQMISVCARLLAISSLEHVAFSPGHALNRKRSCATDRLHELSERTAALLHYQMKVIGHDGEREQLYVRLLLRARNDCAYAIADRLVEPRLVADGSRREVKTRTG